MWCLTSRERLEVLTADSIGRWSIREEATSIRITVVVVFVGDVCQLLLAIFAVLFPLSRLRLGGSGVTDGCWMLCLFLGMEHCGKYVVIAGFT